MTTFITDLWAQFQENALTKAIGWSWVAAIVLFVFAVLIYLIPLRHQRWFLPIINAPAAIVAFIASFILKWTLPLAMILLAIGAISGYNNPESTALAGMWDLGKQAFVIWGGVFFSATSGLLIGERAKQIATAEAAASQARMTQQIRREEELA